MSNRESGPLKMSSNRIVDIEGGPIVRLAGRNFPGVVVQGDSLRGFVRDLDSLMESLADGDKEGAMEAASFLRERLADIVDLYEETLRRLGHLHDAERVLLPLRRLCRLRVNFACQELS